MFLMKFAQGVCTGVLMMKMQYPIKFQHGRMVICIRTRKSQAMVICHHKFYHQTLGVRFYIQIFIWLTHNGSIVCQYSIIFSPIHQIIKELFIHAKEPHN